MLKRVEGGKNQGTEIQYQGGGGGGGERLLPAPAPADSITCVSFARVTRRISAGSFPCPRATWSVRRCTRQKVEPRRRARVTTSTRSDRRARMSLLHISARCHLRRWR